MRLVEPYTRHIVDAPADIAKRLVAAGFEKAEEPKKKAAPRKRAAAKKEQ